MYLTEKQIKRLSETVQQPNYDYNRKNNIHVQVKYLIINLFKIYKNEARNVYLKIV